MNYTITTPLYYVNDKAHIGSSYTTLACDAIARYKRLRGFKVIFITGVDEHGQKIQRTAENNKLQPLDHCNRISLAYKELWQQWSISNDVFIRTTSPNHERVVKSFFQRVLSSNDIYLGTQKGWYCVGCEEYKEVGSNISNAVCPIHNKELEWRDEQNLFFKLSRYQKEIESLVSSEQFIFPKKRKNEIIKFVERGLKDFSISRINLDWGIPVPGYKGHTFYVWFDALLGYISALLEYRGLSDLEDLNDIGWPVDLHIIGKDILRFHAIYWPAMLISAKLELPKRLYGHGFLTKDGLKMGKSVGNVINPQELVAKYGIDAVRWYLLKDFQFGNDGDFQYNRFIDIINNDLSNTIGNLLNRTISMSRKWFSNCTPAKGTITNQLIIDTVNKATDEYIKNMDSQQIHSACVNIIDLASFANVYINEQEPWKDIKDPIKFDKVSSDIYSILEISRIVGLLMYPILPEFSSRIMSQLNINIEISDWNEQLSWGLLPHDHTLSTPIPIMQKLDNPTS